MLYICKDKVNCSIYLNNDMLYVSRYFKILKRALKSMFKYNLINRSLNPHYYFV